MSVDLCVYLDFARLPTCTEWQDAISRAAIPLTLHDVDLRTFSGFLPCKFGAKDCGFEYYFSQIEDQDKEILEDKQPRDHVVRLVLHAGPPEDLKAATFAAAVLTEIADGIFFDPQGGDYATGHGVFDLISQWEEAERERGRRKAAKDAAITDRYCPNCGLPCPSYRLTCKACGAEVGRG